MEAEPGEHVQPGSSAKIAKCRGFACESSFKARARWTALSECSSRAFACCCPSVHTPPHHLAREHVTCVRTDQSLTPLQVFILEYDSCNTIVAFVTFGRATCTTKIRARDGRLTSERGDRTRPATRPLPINPRMCTRFYLGLTTSAPRLAQVFAPSPGIGPSCSTLTRSDRCLQSLSSTRPHGSRARDPWPTLVVDHQSFCPLPCACVGVLAG